MFLIFLLVGVNICVYFDLEKVGVWLLGRWLCIVESFDYWDGEV